MEIAQLPMFIGELQNQYLHFQVLNISFFNFFPLCFLLMRNFM